jgi:hypothetical protein
VGDRGFIGWVKPRNDGLRRVGGDATLRVCGRLQAEEGNEQRSGNDRAPQQELFHFFSPIQKNRTDLRNSLGDVPQDREKPV